jgi:hypothetical protein
MRTESLTVKNGRGSGGFGVDDKYRKRRTQTKEERLRQALMMFAAALVLLCYTWSTLMSIPDTIDQAAAFRASRKGLPARRQREEKPDDERQRRKKEQKTNNERGGMFKNWFGNDDRITTLKQELEELDQRVVQNTNAGIRWSRPELLPAMSAADKPLLDVDARERRKRRGNPDGFFGVKRMRAPTAMAWETEKQKMNLEKGPTVDFTQHSYEYPEKLQELPELGTYPQLVSMRELMDTWPQDDIDHPPSTIKERLIHFDYLNPLDLEAARKFRDAKLPFKLINVPEVIAAGEKWTDEYVALNFDGGAANGKHRYPLAKGTCQESPDNFFAFFAQGGWPVETMGIPPTRNNDLTYAKWAEHARYADASSLHANMPHLYYQAGVDKEERHMDPSQWTFISRDLPSFSSPSETFFVFEPESQKGIQCRFGERGVTAATHFDSGRNMVAMISGAKRYILSPPKECTKLGIITGRGNPVFRHSLLNFGHLNEIDNPEMPSEEREWLERSGDAMALDTVLKAGEVLYIPSHWFHYITSLQKSAQCNVRSGIDIEGDAYFGGNAEVTHMCEPR